jgi:hypothetical protein
MRLGGLMRWVIYFSASDKIRQLAIDDTRYMLYALFERGGVQVGVHFPHFASDLCSLYI